MQALIAVDAILGVHPDHERSEILVSSLYIWMDLDLSPLHGAFIRSTRICMVLKFVMGSELEPPADAPDLCIRTGTAVIYKLTKSSIDHEPLPLFLNAWSHVDLISKFWDKSGHIPTTNCYAPIFLLRFLPPFRFHQTWYGFWYLFSWSRNLKQKELSSHQFFQGILQKIQDKS